MGFTQRGNVSQEFDSGAYRSLNTSRLISIVEIDAGFFQAFIKPTKYCLKPERPRVAIVIGQTVPP